MAAYYNDNDQEAVAVLNALIAHGTIAPGDVDGRSIAEVTADDIKGYTQCHFFAGAGLWSAAARLAGWPDSRPLWTASCPCQPISAAGKRRGADDPRHLWPDLYRIIGAARRAGQRVPVLVGEQVAGSVGYDWFDGVRTDLAREGIAARTVDIPACTVDAPHQRNRLFWCAMANAESVCGGRDQPQRGPEERAVDGRADAGAVGDAIGAGLEGFDQHGDDGAERSQPHRSLAAPNDRNGSFWADAEWITCHDGKARRTKPGLPMLVDGMAGRASLWRLAGNSIVPQLAAEVLAAILDVEGGMR